MQGAVLGKRGALVVHDSSDAQLVRLVLKVLGARDFFGTATVQTVNASCGSAIHNLLRRHAFRKKMVMPSVSAVKFCESKGDNPIKIFSPN